MRRPTVEFVGSELVYYYPRFWVIEKFIYGRRVKLARLLVGFAVLIFPDCPVRTMIKNALGGQ